MSLDRTRSTTSVIDVLDHVLDKGIVIDAWVRVSLAGIDLVGVEARVVVASISTYLARASAISQLEPVSRPHARPGLTPRATLHDQLRRVEEQLALHRFESQTHRRAEDRLLDEFHDAHAKTITRH